MAGTDWVAGLTVVKLKDELKKRGLAVSGKKAELVARLEEHLSAKEVRVRTSQCRLPARSARAAGLLCCCCCRCRMRACL